jgi:hypothetical protein
LTSFYPDARPFTRWWWFSGPRTEKEVEDQLDWLRASGFGGVEIAWVYPLPGSLPGPRWLSPRWSERVARTKRACVARGLGCDFTFGTLWPFGGSIVEERDAAKTFSGLSAQRLRKSWEEPWTSEAYVLDHLDRGALARYADRMGEALKPAMGGGPSALFCDSWEVAVEGLSTRGFLPTFQRTFGYELGPRVADLSNLPDVRYDYRKLLSHVVLEEFYRPFTETAGKLGGFSRVQCHGAPVDLLAAYAAVDVPESEALLFDPPFSLLAASAAAMAGKEVVSAETFTCLYGWEPYPGPGPYHRREQAADLKLLVDAMLASGVNFVVWHGMPFQSQGNPSRFYATVHVGPDAAFAGELPGFNAYLARVSGLLRRGRTVTGLGVYLPLEDAWMKGELPAGQRRPSARYHWELQHERLPQETAGFRPLWVSLSFLEKARFHGGAIQCGDAVFPALYVDVEWLDEEGLDALLALARAGGRVVLRREPSQPGHVKSDGYAGKVAELASLPNVRPHLGDFPSLRPLVEGEDLPEFFVRQAGGEAFVFFAHPMTRDVRYPMPYGQALCTGPREQECTLRLFGREFPLHLVFPPYQSLLFRVTEAGEVEEMDIRYVPPEPGTE